jgi:hypothetical protein
VSLHSFSGEGGIAAGGAGDHNRENWVCGPSTTGDTATTEKLNRKVRFCMKHMLLLSVLLLGVSWAAAQDSSAPSQSDSSASQTAAGQATAGAKASVQGCLSGSDGKYILTDKQGMTYNLTGDTSKLADNVGHEIKVTGTTGGGSASGASNGMNDSSQTIEVASIKHIAKTCQSGGGMSK